MAFMLEGQHKVLIPEVLIPEVVYHQGKQYINYTYGRYTNGRYTYSTLPKPYGVDGLNGWWKSITRAVKKVVKPITKIITAPVRSAIALVKGDFKDAAGIVVAPWAGSKATRGRILRRAGGVVTGAVTGFATGGPIGALIGGATGGIMAKKGVKGIKGYGKIGLVGAVTGGAAGMVAGAAAETGFSTGLLSQSTAQNIILSSGRAGMIGMGVAAGAPIPLIGAIGVKTIGAVTSIGKGVLGMLAPKAQAPEASAEGTSYMDLIKNTSGVSTDTSRLYSQSRVNGQTWGGGYNQYMPTPTGADLPGQETGTQVEYEEEQPTTAELLPKSIDKNMLFIVGGIGLLALMFYQKERR